MAQTTTKRKPAVTKAPPKKPKARRQPRKPAERPRFSILVCIDESEESLEALRYAVRVGSGTDADLTLLYVRPIDQGLRTGGLQISVVRENLLEWGLELPGMKALTRGRELLVELGWLDKDWEAEFAHVDVTGDPLGDNAIVYSCPTGRSIVLRLLVAPSVAFGILDEAKLGDFDLVVISKPVREDDTGPGYISPSIATRVAKEHVGTVLVTQALEESHGHLVCVSNNRGSILAARKDAEIASRCACPVFLLSVAKNEAALKVANRAVASAKREIEKVGIRVSGEKVLVGNPVSIIVEEGKKHSVIVVSRFQRRSGWRQIFSNSIAFKVLDRAENSVMIAR